jgi:enoyl-[acyl-carrier protein] reductase II
MIKTKLCNLLGIEYPVFQGGMAWVSTAKLAAAVSEAGGLGIIGSGHNDAQWVRDQIRKPKNIQKNLLV